MEPIVHINGETYISHRYINELIEESIELNESSESADWVEGMHEALSLIWLGVDYARKSKSS